MSTTKTHRRLCYHCGKVIPEGRSVYRLTGVLFADFDGVLEEPGDAASISKSLHRTIKKLDRQSVEEAERDVHQYLDLLLCGACRTILERDWLTDRRADRADPFLH